MAGQVKVEGVGRLIRDLGKLEGRSLDVGLRGEWKSVAGGVARSAKSGGVVPVVTGALMRSIRSTTTGGGGGVAAGTDSSVRYAGPIHFGWPARGIRASPFLYVAVEDEEDETVRLLERGVQRVIDRNGLG